MVRAPGGSRDVARWEPLTVVNLAGWWIQIAGVGVGVAIACDAAGWWARVVAGGGTRCQPT